ncbi:hypothetical protein M8J75_004038 [Diaphorina citri]|nr:hypothetical protein M8J75_004038 [Diaphorina citri]KAI5747157.1 hypothetical protein M8J77_011694 [Diaphorina citri]
MGSENTVTSSIPIPNWMKSKLNDKYNLDDSAFSPPGDDDGFFHIPYPKHNKSTSDFIALKEQEDDKFISITKALNLNSTSSSGSHNNNNDFDLSKHTLPCQKYIGGMCDPAQKGINKSYGTDDGFKGEASLCGQSIVAVAEQMVRSNQLYNGRASDDTFNATGLPNDKYLRPRRNSRSLPASPLSRRKNPFFTPPILAHVDDPAPDPNPRYIAPAAARAAAKLRDVSPGGGTGGLRAKPTELREINFWSPTSM